MNSPTGMWNITDDDDDDGKSMTINHNRSYFDDKLDKIQKELNGKIILKYYNILYTYLRY